MSQRRNADPGEARSLGFWTASRLQLYGCAIALIYACFLASCYRAGTWIIDHSGASIYTDFACGWIATVQALRGHAASLYDPVSFIAVQAAVVGPRDNIYPNWPYPPIFLLFMAPFAALRYVSAFLTWDVSTLIGCIAAVYAITRRTAAIALVLAFPFTAWNFLAAQNGFLTAALLGGALLFLERRPLLAGLCIGCLTYKPQFGVLFPVALIAARQWRTIAGAAISAAVLAGCSVAVYGIGVWAAFPGQLSAQTDLNLLADPASHWGYLQSVYGLVRTLRAGAAAAWLTQGITTLGSAVAVWWVWRSQVRFSLKAAVLSAAALIATPYVFAYDMAAIVIPAAFLVSDQIRCGLLRGEQTMMIALFGGLVFALIVLRDPPDGVTFGGVPLGPIVVFTLLGLVLRRSSHNGDWPAEPPIDAQKYEKPDASGSAGDDAAVERSRVAMSAS